MALCEGPISGIGAIWRDQSTYTLAQLGLTLFNGTTPQTVWGYLSSAYPIQALAYQGTCYACAASYQLGDQADIGNHNFEIIGALAGTGVNGIDADPARVINDFLINPQYGVGFDPPPASMRRRCSARAATPRCRPIAPRSAFAFSPALVDQEQGSSILSRWLQILNCAAVWSGGQLKFIPYGDAGDPRRQCRSDRSIRGAYPGAGELRGHAAALDHSLRTSRIRRRRGRDLCIHGRAADLYRVSPHPLRQARTDISPQGTYLFAGGDESQVVSISYTYASPTSYVPNLTPIYDLTDLDFVDEKGNKDPVQAARLDPFSLPTIQRVECLSRTSEYGATPVEARDQSQIELYGPRVGSTIQAHEICDEVTIGPMVAQTILQRLLYVRAHFTFKLSWEYGLLDPMDIVTISDANLGLSNYPVRITTIEEDDKGLLTVTAEELTVGVSTPVLYPNSGPSGFLPNRAVAADPINAPLIYEPPSALTGGTAQIWVGASGGTNGVCDPNWGGANVWISLDDVTYSQTATITQPLRQGFLTAALPLANGWDSADTLSVNLAESGAVLSGTSMSGAQSGATRSLVDGELLSYESATLTAPNVYNLAGLQRGIYTTSGASHSSGAAFCRLDSAVVQHPLQSQYIGQTLYFKFQSFNVFGGGGEALSSCIAYTYVPTGAALADPIATQLLGGFPVDLGNVTTTASVLDDFGNAVTASSAVIDLGNA